jgi:hypothetical protein
MRLAVLATCALMGCVHGDNNAPAANPDLSPVMQVQQPVGTPVVTNYQPFREGIDLSSSQTALDHNLTSDHFNFSELRELWVRVKVNGITDTTLVHMTLTTPSGSTFYETTVPYSPDPGTTAMYVPKGPHEITVYHTLPMGTGHALIYVIPVAGSAMARYPVPGTWHLQVEIQGHRTLSADIEVSYT